MSDSGDKAEQAAAKAAELAEDAAEKAKAIATALEEGAHKALDAASDGAAKGTAALEEGAHKALDSLEHGATKLNTGAHAALEAAQRRAQAALAKADAALSAPAAADLTPLLAATDLPELPSAGALGSLGVRLDREADLYRNVALRELARVSWIDRVTLISVMVAFIGEAGVAACAAFSGLIGSNDGRGSLFALAATILAVAPAGVAAVVAGARRMHKDLAADALTRSRSIEERLFQLGVVMEWRGTEPALFQDALARLEATRSGRSRDDGDAPA